MSVPQVLQPPEPPVLDNKVWQAWLAKNRREEHAGFDKRLKIMVSVSPFLLAALLYWLLKTA